MERIDDILAVLDQVMDTRRKRHIVGGILVSVSLLFGGLAYTVITLKMEDEDDDGRLN